MIEQVVYSRKNPFFATVIKNENMNGDTSNKQTHHVEISVQGSGFHYEPGDSIGIYPLNEEVLVDALIAELALDENEVVQIQDESLTLKEALYAKLEITLLSRSLLQKISAFTASEALSHLLEDKEVLKEYASGRDLLDAAEDFGPFTWTAQQFVELLRSLSPRLYSIASSQKAHPDAAHLTIGKVFYEKSGRLRLGVCSGGITERLQVGDEIPVYVHANPHFKLPEDTSVPIIMIGAGTGIAPFRSFMQQRVAEYAKGKTWLFFGDQHEATDFLYRNEWEDYLKEGTLTNLSVAFSRDTEQKVYVQHRLKQHAAEVFEWLEQGAFLYVCGDKSTLAIGVDEALLEIVQQQGQLTEEEAVNYIAQLKKDKRYQKDVY